MATYNGTDGDDSYAGGPDNDYIFGNGGNDVLTGGAGEDWLDGGAGTDTADYSLENGTFGVTVNVATYEIYSASFQMGPQSAYDSYGARDTVIGIENVKTGAGNDRVYGGYGANRIETGAGADSINGGPGADTMIGGAGDDGYTVDDVGDVVIEQPNEGIDGVLTTLASYTLPTNVENLMTLSASGVTLTGNELDNSITGWVGNDVLGGAGGNDVLDGRQGSDAMTGGSGDDIYYVDNAGDTVTEAAGGGIDEVRVSLAEYWLPDNVENIVGRNVGQTLHGNALDNVMSTASFSPTTVDPGPGGRDTVVGNWAQDTLKVDWSDSTRSVILQGDANLAKGGADGSLADGDVRSVNFVSVDRIELTTGSGDDVIHGPTALGDSRISTGAGNDTVTLGGGNDVLDGGAGGDWMEGGGGNDVYFVDNESDSIVERSGEGTDEVRTVFAVASLLGSHVENLTSNADVGHDFRGSALNNVIRGGAQRDMIRLQDGGNDSAVAGAGNDTIYFGAAFTALDTVDGGIGVDAIILQGNYSAGVTLGSGTTSNISGVESISLAPGHFADWGDTAGNFYDYNLTAIDANVPAGGILRINGHHLRAGEDFTFNGALEADGRFFVFGGLGVDRFTGGSGNDIFVFGHDGRFGQTDVLHGGPGYDSIYLRGDYDLDFTQNGFGIFTGIESITLGWASDSQFVVGGDGEFDYRIVWKDSMIESGVRITVNGSGLAANETMIFDASDESGGHFRLFGGAANDTITGGGGDDLIYGGLGWDTLVGNGGSDTFVYYDTAESSITPGTFDQINGFTHLVDKIDLPSSTPTPFSPGTRLSRSSAMRSLPVRASFARYSSLSPSDPIPGRSKAIPTATILPTSSSE